MYITIKYLQHKGESNYFFKLQTQISIQMQPPKEKFSSKFFQSIYFVERLWKTASNTSN